MITNPKEKTIRVLRSFCIEGEPVPVGEVLTLPFGMACELIGSNKAVEVKQARVAVAPAQPVAQKQDETVSRPSRRSKS